MKIISSEVMLKNKAMVAECYKHWKACQSVSLKLEHWLTKAFHKSTHCQLPSPGFFTGILGTNVDIILIRGRRPRGLKHVNSGCSSSKTTSWKFQLQSSYIKFAEGKSTHFLGNELKNVIISNLATGFNQQASNPWQYIIHI